MANFQNSFYNDLFFHCKRNNHSWETLTRQQRFVLVSAYKRNVRVSSNDFSDESVISNIKKDLLDKNCNEVDRSGMRTRLAM